MIKNKGLGKGLSALLGDDNNSKENIVEIKNFKTDKTPIHQLVPNQFQPRKNFEKKQLEELAASIKSRGIIQPIAVRKISDDKLYAYNVYQIEGEGRSLFAKIEGDENTIMGLPINKIKEYLQSHE